MPIKRIKKNIKESSTFDWLALLILFSFTLISINIIAKYTDEYNDELDADIERMKAEVLLRK